MSGEARFVSTVARRLQSLGALSGGGGGPTDNAAGGAPGASRGSGGGAVGRRGGAGGGGAKAGYRRGGPNSRWGDVLTSMETPEGSAALVQLYDALGFPSGDTDGEAAWTSLRAYLRSRVRLDPAAPPTGNVHPSFAVPHPPVAPGAGLACPGAGARGGEGGTGTMSAAEKAGDADVSLGGCAGNSCGDGTNQGAEHSLGHENSLGAGRDSPEVMDLDGEEEGEDTEGGAGWAAGGGGEGGNSDWEGAAWACEGEEDEVEGEEEEELAPLFSCQAYPTAPDTARARRKLESQLRRGVGMLLAEYTAGGPARNTGGGASSSGAAGIPEGKGPLPRAKAGSVTLFLNRLLGLPLSDQARLLDLFSFCWRR